MPFQASPLLRLVSAGRTRARRELVPQRLLHDARHVRVEPIAQHGPQEIRDRILERPGTRAAPPRLAPRRAAGSGRGCPRARRGRYRTSGRSHSRRGSASLRAGGGRGRSGARAHGRLCLACAGARSGRRRRTVARFLRLVRRCGTYHSIRGTHGRLSRDCGARLGRTRRNRRGLGAPASRRGLRIGAANARLVLRSRRARHLELEPCLRPSCNGRIVIGRQRPAH